MSNVRFYTLHYTKAKMSDGRWRCRLVANSFTQIPHQTVPSQQSGTAVHFVEEHTDVFFGYFERQGATNLGTEVTASSTHADNHVLVRPPLRRR